MIQHATEHMASHRACHLSVRQHLKFQILSTRHSLLRHGISHDCCVQPKGRQCSNIDHANFYQLQWTTSTKQWLSTELELKNASTRNHPADFWVSFSLVFQPFLFAKVQIMLEKYSNNAFLMLFLSKSAFHAKFNAGIMCDTLTVSVAHAVFRLGGRVSTSKLEGPSSGRLTRPKVQSNGLFVRPLAVDHKAAVAIRTKTLRLVEEETRLAARKSSGQGWCSVYML